MTKLVAVKDVASRFTIPDEATLLSKMAASLDAATVYLEDILKTPLAAVADTTDTFTFLDVQSTPFEDDECWYFKLKRGYLSGDPVLKLGPIRSELSSQTAIDSDYWAVDFDSGLISLSKYYVAEYAPAIYQPNWNRKATLYLAATYSAGYSSSADPYGTTYDSVPSWMAEAALQIGFGLYTGADCSDKGKAGKMGVVPSHLRSMLTEHIRFLPYAKPAQ